MKYVFETEEIENCLECPFSTIYIMDDEIQCKINRKWYKGDKMPDNCPLEVQE